MAKPLNIAHRGGAGLWPENTLYAFIHAAKSGFDGAELDVQLTRDGTLAVFHDFRLSSSLCRGADSAWLRPPFPLLRNLSYDDLAVYDVGRPRPRSLYARRHRNLAPVDGERIPSLGDVIETVRALREDFRLFIEIKTSAEDRALSATPEAAADAVVAVLRGTRFLTNSVLVGFDWPALIRAKQLAPEIPCWFTTMRRRIRARGTVRWAGGFDPRRFGGSIPKAIAAAGGDGWFAAYAQVGARAVREARDLGLKVGVWTVNDTRRMRRVARLGVDAICTDRPDRLAALLARRTD